MLKSFNLYKSYYYLPYWRWIKKVVNYEEEVTCINEISLNWLKKLFPEKSIKDFRFKYGELSGGLSGEMAKLILVLEDSTEESFVVKTVKQNFASFRGSIETGANRETLFYNLENSRSTSRNEFLPKIFYSHGSLRDGYYIIIMEDLSKEYIVGTKVLGNQCWGPVELEYPLNEQQQFDMLLNIFRTMAERFHGKYWRDDKKLFEEIPFLKFRKILTGQGESVWKYNLDQFKSTWYEKVKNVYTSTPNCIYQDEYIQVIEKLIEDSSYEKFQKEFNIKNEDVAFTLCHGDFHAGNMLVNIKDPCDKFYLVDWSEVGIFCPFTDIAQYIISNCTIEFRRNYEKALFRGYYEKLIENKNVNKEIFTFDKCYQKYKIGGIEKWLQLNNLLGSLTLPPSAFTFFHNQVSSFIHDHYPSVKNDLKTILTCYKNE